MPKILLILLLLLYAPHQYQALSLIHEEHKLNSGSRPGGITRCMIKLSIPPHTDYLVYSLLASPKNPVSDLGLHTQLHDKVKKDGVLLSMSSNIINDLLIPQGDGVTDVLIIKDKAAAKKYVEDKEDVPYMEDYSRQNIANCIIGIPIKYSEQTTVLYLCLRNPGAFNAEFVTVEVVAMQRL